MFQAQPDFITFDPMKPDIKNRSDIQLMIDTFYKKVRAEKSIAYIFDEVVKVNWENHLPIMYDFWEITLFHTGAYRRNTMKIHMDLHQKTALTKAHFDLWLQIFTETVDELFEGEAANNAKTRANSIATMMQFKIYDSGRLI